MERVRSIYNFYCQIVISKNRVDETNLHGLRLAGGYSLERELLRR